MTIYIIFFIILAIFSVRTVAYGVYAFKKEGKLAGISVFVLDGFNCHCYLRLLRLKSPPSNLYRISKTSVFHKEARRFYL